MQNHAYNSIVTSTMIYNVKCEKIKYQLKSGINTVKHTHKAIITVITVSEYEIEMS